MKLELQKFGTTLISRQAGREAFAAFQPRLRNIQPNETIEIDFNGILTFSPSWGDEFLRPLQERFDERLILLKSENPSVKATLSLLEKIGNKKFRRE